MKEVNKSRAFYKDSFDNQMKKFAAEGKETLPEETRYSV